MHREKRFSTRILRIVSVWSILLLFSGCVMVGNLTGIQGSGDLVTMEQNISDFTQVAAHHSCKLRITQGEDFEVVVRIDDNLAEHLRVEKKGDSLDIGMARGFNYGRMTLEADVTMPDLDGVQLSGASNAEVVGFSFTHDLDLGLSGASELVSQISTGDLVIHLSGASEVELEGRGDDVLVNASGASSADLAEFEARDVEVQLSGASSARLNLHGRLSGDASGAASVSYRGDPSSVSVSKSGGASVRAQ